MDFLYFPSLLDVCCACTPEFTVIISCPCRHTFERNAVDLELLMKAFFVWQRAAVMDYLKP
jgi:hypothetical protein